jgi:hypothetical protein
MMFLVPAAVLKDLIRVGLGTPLPWEFVILGPLTADAFLC